MILPAIIIKLTCNGCGIEYVFATRKRAKEYMAEQAWGIAGREHFCVDCMLSPRICDAKGKR